MTCTQRGVRDGEEGEHRLTSEVEADEADQERANQAEEQEAQALSWTGQSVMANWLFLIGCMFFMAGCIINIVG